MNPGAPAPAERAGRLAGLAEAIGLDLEPGQIASLDAYLNLLQRWNSVYNLTAVRDPDQMLVQHIADSLAIVPALVRHAAGRPMRVLDVGSGGGLPGVVLAIARPEFQVICIDTVGKKANFIRQVAAELRLPNLRAEHGRVEERAPSPLVDLIVSRAFASLADFTRLSRTSLGTGGGWCAMKGKHPDAEIAELPADIEVFHVEQLQVPGLDAERCLIWMRPTRPGPDTAPERAGAQAILRPMARIFCIANQKGGVGKTTTTVNLAAGLARAGQRVLVVDLDPQGNATMGSGVDKRALELSVYDVLLESATIAEAKARSEAGGYDMLGANRELAGAEVELVALEHRHARLRDALKVVDADYDFVLIDCPPSLSLLTLNGLCSAHGVIVPMQCEYFALEGLSDLVNTIKQVHANLNPQLEIIGLLRVMFDPAHHAAAAGERPAQGPLRRQGVRHRHPAQRAPGRGPQLRPARRGVRPGRQGRAGLHGLFQGNDRPARAPSRGGSRGLIPGSRRSAACGNLRSLAECLVSL